MKIIIPDIPREGIDVDVHEAVSFDDSLFTVRGQLRVEKAGVEIWIRGTLRAEGGLQCSRCLTTVVSEMTIPVDVLYQPLEEMKGNDRREMTSDELDLDFYRGDELDIGGLLQEQVALNIPMKPLCHDACKGLCSQCGADLNLSTCTCGRGKRDPRFEELKKMEQNMKGDVSG